VGMSFINKKAPERRLFEPEAFHTENYKKYTTIYKAHLNLPTPLISVWWQGIMLSIQDLKTVIR
jgi:hypothetical protein